MAQQQSDEQLLARFTRGDRAALGELASRHESLLVGLATGLLGGRADLARDAVQDSWVKVIKHGKSFAGQSSFKTWLYRIVINRCKDVRERESRPRMHPEDSMLAAAHTHEAHEPPPSMASQHAELNGTLRAAVDELGGPQRLVVLLCYHRGLTHTEAADVLGIPVGTLKSRLNAALKDLRAQLGMEVQS
jgi:RNA polymerase sigma-70 factor (ECF subfamily)